MMGTDSSRFGSVAELRAWCVRAPAGTHLDAHAVAEILAPLVDEPAEDKGPAPAPLEPATWREKLWTVDGATRLGVVEVAEALDRPKSYVYARTGPSAANPLPHRKLDGSLVFTAGELRAWIRDHEDVVHGGPMDPPSGTLKAVS